jgi:Tfp pilus assembly protein PilN
MRPINLLPDLRVRRRERLQLALPRLLTIAAMIWLLLLAALYGGIHWHHNRLQGRLQSINAQIQALEPVAQRVAERQELTQSVHDLRVLIAVNTQGLVVPTMDLIASLLPTQISVQQLAVDEDQLSLACQSTALAPIGQLYTNLHHTQQFSSIQFSAISGLDRSGYAFTVTLRLVGAASHD